MNGRIMTLKDPTKPLVLAKNDSLVCFKEASTYRVDVLSLIVPSLDS
jgi:hypothetical protein